uniref:Fucosyltransferase n=1 Tax=Hemiselmis tepida TaxID=464990 RepID=A0A7S0WGA3_9CRYP|mmetsp:Transcript_9459/g.24755  ORF Transcript_9459/g.24755 Transcript_9459/m.24755 type:complete len:727 (+) Transcript_9459:184-2364(+)
MRLRKHIYVLASSFLALLLIGGIFRSLWTLPAEVQLLGNSYAALFQKLMPTLKDEGSAARVENGHPTHPHATAWQQKLAQMDAHIYLANSTTACHADSRLCNCLGKTTVKAGGVYRNLTGQQLVSREGSSPCGKVAFRQKPLVNVVVSGWLGVELNMGVHDCPSLRCNVGIGTQFAEDTHVVLQTSAGHKIPVFASKKHPAWQMNVLLQMESSVHYPGVKTASYNAGLDAVAGFRQFYAGKPFVPISYVNANEDDFRTPGARFEDRSPVLGVFMSNCQTEGHHRQGFIADLARFVKVESYGGCTPKGTVKANWQTRFPQCRGMPRRSAMWDAVKECVLFHSRFALSVENALEEDYVTEKMWQPLRVGAVPITVGSNISRHLLPHPSAAIYAEDFGSVRDLAEYISRVANSSELWHAHTAWKGGEFSNAFQHVVFNSYTSLGCRVCEGYWVHKQGEPPRGFRMPELKILPCQKELLSRFFRNPWPMRKADERLGVDSLFVVHYSKLKHRKVLMEKRLMETFGVKGVFVNEFDREELNESDFSCFGNREWQTTYIGRPTTNGEDSLSIKHMAVFYYMYRMGIQNALILEDDAAFFHKKANDWLVEGTEWQYILKDLPEDYDSVMMSKFWNFRAKGKSFGPNLVLAQASETTGMSMFSLKGAINMLNSLPVIGPIDFQINYVGRTQKITNERNHSVPLAQVVNVKIFHAEPPLSFQADPSGIRGTVRSK